MKRKYSKLLDKLEKILYKPRYLFQVNYEGKDLRPLAPTQDTDEEIVVVTYKI